MAKSETMELHFIETVLDETDYLSELKKEGDSDGLSRLENIKGISLPGNLRTQ